VRQSDSNNAPKRLTLLTADRSMREMYAQSYAQFSPLTPTRRLQMIIPVPVIATATNRHIF